MRSIQVAKASFSLARYQEIFIKHLPVQNPFSGLFQNIVPDDQIDRKIESQTQDSVCRDKMQCNQHCRGGKNSYQHFFLLPIHFSYPSCFYN